MSDAAYCYVHNKDYYAFIGVCEQCENEPEFDATEAAALTQPGPTDILDRATDFVEARLPHGIELVFERNLAFRTYDVFAQCPHCGAKEITSCLTHAALRDVVSVEALGQVLCQGVYNVLGKCVAGECCDPLDRFVDGLRVRECLEHWIGNIRTLDIYGTRGGFAALTDHQKDAARLAWSAQLRAKQQQTRERERAQVVCERDEDGL
jgi:hypothetical protein